MTEQKIHPDTTLGYVHLTVSDLKRSLDYYQNALGFNLHKRKNGIAHLGAGKQDILVLTEVPGATRPRRASGLYHFATLVPSRLELAQSLKHIAETGTPVEGFADHLVSEAIYLSDPDGNGIEIYRDRPRSEWYDEQGNFKIATDPLDLDGVLAELENAATPSWRGLDPETKLGHMHLHVANLPQAESFYNGVLGFDLMARYGPMASFVSAGGYHHHIAFNTWAGVGVPPPPPGSVGLREFVVRLPNVEEMSRVIDRIQEAGLPIEETDEGVLVRDPSKNAIVLTAE